MRGASYHLECGTVLPAGANERTSSSGASRDRALGRCCDLLFFLSLAVAALRGKRLGRQARGGDVLFASFTHAVGAQLVARESIIDALKGTGVVLLERSLHRCLVQEWHDLVADGTMDLVFGKHSLGPMIVHAARDFGAKLQ